MFTGIVEELGQVVDRHDGRLRVAANTVLEDTHVGGSLSVSGCCLTVVGAGQGWWEADLSEETLARTTLGALAPGDVVNLERPLRLADRLGGHLVQGHVDAVGEVVEPPPALGVRLPRSLSRYVVEKGSVALDGVSLTVVEVDDDCVTATVIPHTAASTTLGRRQRGDGVNVEVDVLARYTERLMAHR